MVTYTLNIREPGKSKPFHRIQDIRAKSYPQIGEIRHVLYDAKTKAGYQQSFRTKVKIVSVEGGLLKSNFQSDGTIEQTEGWHECSWWIVTAEPVAENFLAGLKRMKENT
ncbi:MAG: hypothetical protein A2836_00840 [Candidatus Taylorbacteria bacterium RIFCSPHIGHO2_01_FULL_45_63]|uniref:Uncharacterized protein n=1 Tax=Candidatus Taylorbacteria bacterium RIFCSPHIGHO2_02_FULL_45_35 TaxID=1802311 RepID=A0A1G2MSY0_9BACT|nr:MAG: hypothetical protein A2836_00840 [Candidatus Taylorbacteria bacterium RIFCSPHIGHO2_01_FULL_45_63]OHA26091.1 MAG: hypothetical protein A3D56_02125 [Candidatus Taylorbacteria bacterium RIFCSPHIGHO2_02_FULL_45_35]OHA32495.1 MAG: hypothetical protein A3A22_00175 [Candidatus Taylorbacteria bacterium RIFCSPLOWO2_01_FULL_45_34b]